MHVQKYMTVFDEKFLYKFYQIIQCRTPVCNGNRKKTLQTPSKPFLGHLSEQIKNFVYTLAVISFGPVLVKLTEITFFNEN